MYWIIVAIFQVMEVFTDMLVYWYVLLGARKTLFIERFLAKLFRASFLTPTCRMPLYFEFKLIALIVLQNPTLRLPSTLYSKVVKPYILPHETAIDEFLSRSYLHMISRVADGLQWVVQNGPTLLSSVTAGVKAGVDAAKSNAAEEHRRQLVRKETHDLTVKVSNKIKGN